MVSFKSPVYHQVSLLMMICKPCCKQHRYFWQHDETGWYGFLASGCHDRHLDGLHHFPFTIASTPHFQDSILVSKSEGVPLYMLEFSMPETFILKGIASLPYKVSPLLFKASSSQCCTFMCDVFRLSFR